MSELRPDATAGNPVHWATTVTEDATAPDVAERITAYLAGGGLFNPELANHDAVRDLLIDCRDALEQRSSKVAPDVAECMRLADEYQKTGDGIEGIAATETARAALQAAIEQLKKAEWNAALSTAINLLDWANAERIRGLKR